MITSRESITRTVVVTRDMQRRLFVAQLLASGRRITLSMLGLGAVEVALFRVMGKDWHTALAWGIGTVVIAHVFLARRSRQGVAAGRGSSSACTPSWCWRRTGRRAVPSSARDRRRSPSASVLRPWTCSRRAGTPRSAMTPSEAFDTADGPSSCISSRVAPCSSRLALPEPLLERVRQAVSAAHRG